MEVDAFEPYRKKCLLIVPLFNRVRVSFLNSFGVFQAKATNLSVCNWYVEGKLYGFPTFSWFKLNSCTFPYDSWTFLSLAASKFFPPTLPMYYSHKLGPQSRTFQQKRPRRSELLSRKVGATGPNLTSAFKMNATHTNSSQVSYYD